MPLLVADGLCKRFGRRQVVGGVRLEVEPGEVVGLLGANGAGKSTTFRMMVGLLRPNAGTIHFADRDVTRMPMYARARLGMGYLAQEPTIFAQLSVADNIRIVLEQHCPRRDRPARLDQLLDELHLSHLRDSRAGSLSGGERRRLEITRALVVQPRLLFFDEPFAGVDPKSRDDIRAISHDLKGRGISVVITDHNAEAILSMVDRLYVMEAGSILAAGTPQEIVDNREVRKAYLGESFVMPAPVLPNSAPVETADESPAAP
jgi:lipopolysaccharide export system ATP-binding protein